MKTWVWDYIRLRKKFVRRVKIMIFYIVFLCFWSGFVAIMRIYWFFKDVWLRNHKFWASRIAASLLEKEFVCKSSYQSNLRCWTKEICKPLWMLSRHQAHADWLKNLVSVRRRFGIISNNLTLSIHKKPRQDPYGSKFAVSCSTIRWITVFGSKLWHQTRSGSTWSITIKASVEFQKAKLIHPFQSKINLERRLWFAFGGTSKESCILNLCRMIAPSTLNFTASNLIKSCSLKTRFFKQDNAFDNSVFLLIVNTSNGKINFVRSKVSRETKFNCLSGETRLLDTSCSLSLMRYDCLEHLLSQTIRTANEKRSTYLIVSKKVPKMRIECRMPLMQ